MLSSVRQTATLKFNENNDKYESSAYYRRPEEAQVNYFRRISFPRSHAPTSYYDNCARRFLSPDHKQNLNKIRATNIYVYVHPTFEQYWKSVFDSIERDSSRNAHRRPPGESRTLRLSQTYSHIVCRRNGDGLRVAIRSGVINRPTVNLPSLLFELETSTKPIFIRRTVFRIISTNRPRPYWLDDFTDSERWNVKGFERCLLLNRGDQW